MMGKAVGYVDGGVGVDGFPPVYTVEQVARGLQISEKTVREMLAGGKIAGKKVGREWRIPRKAILSFMDEDDERW